VIDRQSFIEQSAVTDIDRSAKVIARHKRLIAASPERT